MNILEQIRTERHLTQTEMCKIIEIDQRNYTRLVSDLNNGKDLKISIGINLAKHFGISLDEIYGIKKSDSSETELPEIVSIYNQLTEQGKAELLNFAKFKLSEQNG